MQPCDNFAPVGVDAAAAEAAVLTFYNSQPDGSIVMMSVWDTGQNCAADCKNATFTVGGSGASISWRGNKDLPQWTYLLINDKLNSLFKE